VKLWEEKGEIIQFMKIIVRIIYQQLPFSFLQTQLPAYEKLLFLLGKLTKELPNLKHTIDASAAKLLKNLGKLLCMHSQCVMGLSRLEPCWYLA
jgi:hypothetical protein